MSSKNSNNSKMLKYKAFLKEVKVKNSGKITEAENKFSCKQVDPPSNA
jgi:hypothetical protein